jgi:MYXO-CTERM domain-containing protein
MRSVATTPARSFHAPKAMLAASLASAIGSVAAAGPVWDIDYTDDARQTAGTAQVITASLSPYINIFGRLDGYGFVGSDFVDMYQIHISSQTLVSISTAGGSLGGSADFNTQLFIFRRKGGNGNNVRAAAMSANNDAALGNLGSRIGDEFDPTSDYTLLSPGYYYLAITGYGTMAVNDGGGLIWSGLDAPGATVSGNEQFLGDWEGQGAIGEYHIRLQAVSGNAAPAPGAVALLGLAGIIRRRRR